MIDPLVIGLIEFFHLYINLTLAPVTYGTSIHRIQLALSRFEREGATATHEL